MELKNCVLLSMMSMSGAAFAAANAQIINSQSYVKHGLVAQYDGIDNAGFDTHDSDAATWVNLAGNSALDGTVDSSVIWGEDGWSVTNDCNPITVGNALSQTTGTGTFSIQFACKPQRGANSGRQCFFSQYDASNSLGIEHRGADVPDCIRFYSSARATGLASKASGLTANVWGSITVTGDNGMRDICFYKNLEPWGERHFKNAAIINSACKSIIGGEAYVNERDMAFRGTFNALRVYGRVLTEEEIKINAAVDAVRFNGADWSDYPELADYSFAADGTLQFNLAANAEEGGMVRLGDGAEEVGVGVAYEYDGTAQSATFTAVPDSGYAFYRWVGDIGAIAEGSPTTPTITVASAKAATLTAVFRKQWRGITSRSYVTPGLVAQYDGIRNVGHDAAHSDSATTWVDLTGNGNDAVKGANITWIADGWQNNVNGKPMNITASSFSAVTASKVFTMQFAVKPSRHDVRQCFFGQFNQRGFTVEHNSSAGNLAKVGFFRFYYYAISGTGATTDDVFGNSLTLQTDEWASMSAVSELDRQSIWKNGTSSLTLANSLNCKLTNICESVIGGDYNRPEMAFRGTYNAFRLYSRALTEDEIKVNAAVDAIRFNGASASSYTLTGGYSFAADGTLMVDVSATATAGGKVKYRDGAAAASVSSTLTQDGSECAVFTAVPDDGCVFQEWTGDVSAITDGTILTERIVVDSTRPVSLTAVFRKGNGALDGMVLDLEITSEREGPFQEAGSWRVGNALKLSDRPYTNTSSSCYYTLYTKNLTNYPDYSPNFRRCDIPVPAAPGVTNTAQTCIYYPQYSISDTSLFGVRTETRHTCVEGPVATFYVRFFWEGSTRESQHNMCTLLMNGIDGTSAVSKHGQGFMLRLYSPANTGKAFPDAFVCNSNITHYTSSEADTGSDLYIETNRWVDCVVSVYPSPTDESLSNMDIWYCQEPASASARPVLKHRHIGDAWAHPKMTTSASIFSGIMIGSVHSGAGLTDYYAQRAFRGSIAAVKAWRRVLSENEIWSLMTGPYGGTFSVGVENGSADEFGADGEVEAAFNPATMEWRHMKKTLTAADRTLTLEVPLAEGDSGLPRVLELVPLFDGVGETCPVTVAANGSTVGTLDLAKADERAILLRGVHAQRNPGGNLVLTITRPEGCAGALSFDTISLCGSWNVGAKDGVPPVLSWNDPALSLLFDIPKADIGIRGYRYRTKIASLVGRDHAVSLALNGVTVWTASSLSVNQVIDVNFGANDMKPGLNELTWHLDAIEANRSVSFDFHRLKMVPPPARTVFVIR